MENGCLYCGEKLKGRADKKFCDSSCRNSYNNQKNTDINKTMRNISNRLRKNRRILAEILPENEETKKIKKEYLLKKGFNFQYFTHVYTTQKGKIYHFVFDMGYLELGDDWYLIVQREEN
ncbi:hypothetical protein NMK71_06895 [Weeksellaceae bacterium KMM 9713]|uniref:DUF2116 family Zn-ribbon domain-containing protein n=1 Tax=Profundicola chukchiensis TaxID=2961959 RepID=A0A9X4RWR0_9FLAO|nr:hypothetical protein [Profundicola chukchiensis]MDG4946137.1 hypothetical protein [Profundicola chukchiensis]